MWAIGCAGAATWSSTGCGHGTAGVALTQGHQHGVRSLPIDPESGSTAAYALSIPRRFTFGTLGRVHPNVRVDFVESLDFSIFKIFKYWERLTVRFRA